MLSLAPSSALLLLLSGFIFYVARLSTRSDDASGYKHLLSTAKSILQPRNASLRQLLGERARANQRLVRALNLSNTFVSGDEGVHKDFVARAQRLLSGAQRKGWRDFQSVVRDAVAWQLASPTTTTTTTTTDNPHSPPAAAADKHEHPFDTAVQNITLAVVLVGLLGVDADPSTLAPADVSAVAQHITALWALSKTGAPIPPHLLAELTARLRRLAPDADALPAPLDLVVPAWETLWRVVATTAACAHDSNEARAAFVAFAECPSAETFRAEAHGGGAGVSVRNIVAEAMRLHPPSKRIGRAAVCGWWPSWAALARWAPRRIVKADVGALLESEELWGRDCREFVPGRHQAGCVLPEQKEAMSFVFGQGQLRCIAASWAPMAAAVIVGTILEEYVVVSGGAVGGREGWKGWALRRKSESDDVYSHHGIPAALAE